MAIIEYDDLKQGKQYNNFRFQVMSDVWGAETRPYRGDNGDPTIGTYLDMIAQGTASGDFEVIVNQIVPHDKITRVLLDELWTAANGSYSTNGQLRSALDQVLADNDIGGKFAFASLGKMQAALDRMSSTAFAESGITTHDIHMPYSQ
jgi:hypothetical protein